MADRPLSPRIVADAGLCIGCGACAAGRGALGWDDHGQLKPAGAWAESAPSTFARICPFSPDAVDEDRIAADRLPDAPHRDPLIGRYEAAYVGHAAEGGFRAQGSSGGMVSWVAAELLRAGLIDGVAHVAPADIVAEGRFFRYRIARTVEEIGQGARSRYYPIELAGVLDEIRRVPGRYAIVGIPCFIKAVQLLRREDPLLRERIAYTLGLFCGHMKSARFVESFAWQLDVPITQVRAVEYRRKDPDRPANWYTAQLMLADGSERSRDWWHLVDGDWGAGFFQNNACNYCDDVVAETADVAFGDAWVEPYASDGRGTNVVIARAPEIARLIEDGIGGGRLRLEPVDAAFIVGTQAAGFRQRREGLAWRLATAPPALPLRKRVTPDRGSAPRRRRAVYALRRRISADGHKIFALARMLRSPALYRAWATLMMRAYEGFAYARGPVGRALDIMARLRAR